MATKKPSVEIMAFDDAKYRAEDDMRTLTRAKEIEKDRARMAAAKKCADQKIKEMQSIVSKKPAPASKAPSRKK